MEGQKTDYAWFAVQVKPRYEFKTAEMLRSKGFEEFVPSYLSQRQWSDRQKSVMLPLFTSYIFCKMCAKKKLPVITTAGVLRIVGSRQGPIPISNEEIEAIQKVTRSAKNVKPHPFVPAFLPGSRVKIEEGPLAGIEGTLLQYTNRAELLISVDLIQQAVSIEIDGDAVSLVKSPPPHALAA
jgi:transcription antitermination factor NusG